MTTLRSRPARRIARRVAGAFVVVLGLLALSLIATVRSFRQLSAAETETATLDVAKHTGHNVAGLVREQYIHQAHSIIEWDRSHVDHYRVAADAAEKATKRLLALPLTDEERAQATQIATLVSRVDRDFSELILPAIDSGDRERVHQLHEQTAERVDRVVNLSEALNRKLEERAMDASVTEEQLGRHAAILVIGCFVLAIVVTGAAWLVIGQSVLRRLSELRHGALQLAGGHLDARVPVRGSDEVADLAATFNEMAVSLTNNQQKLVHSQRLAVIGQVAAGVAHEINNPLGVILGYVKLLGRPNPPSDGLRIIEDEVRQCQRIVRRLLDLARPIAAQRALVNLGELARDAVERLSESESLEQRTLHAPPARLDVYANGDASALRQVVGNLLQNAVEATSSSGSVTLRVRELGDTVELEVKDDGPGIPAAAIGKVFDPFFTTKPTGTGLGLAISHAIVAAHDGAIQLVSEPGEGTRAIVRLPGVAAVTAKAST
jgi:two-component system, NtrC family, sensor kinase